MSIYVEKIELMPEEEYSDMCKKAIDLLTNCQYTEEGRCIVDGWDIRVGERDLLLNQLLGDGEYLKMPLKLFLGSYFWMNLKVESNNRVALLEKNDN